MRVALTGATGRVGYPIAVALARAGHALVTLGRRPVDIPGIPLLDWELGGAVPALDSVEVLVHAAFSHVPDRYRGGEGDDPEGFMSRNLDGSLRLFAAAKAAGVRRVVFLSSRAVYGDYAPGTVLHEGLTPRPDTLYGRMKLEAETALAASGLSAVSLRATGVFGVAPPGGTHKWQALFDAFERGETIAPAIGTEVSAGDLAAAVKLLLRSSAEGAFNASDLILDRRELLEEWSQLSGCEGRLPPASDPAGVSVMDCGRLRALGWQPRGHEGLRWELLGMLLYRTP